MAYFYGILRIIYFFSLLIYFERERERERERASTSRGEAEREGERIPNRPHAQHGSILRPEDHDLSRYQESEAQPEPPGATVLRVSLIMSSHSESYRESGIFKNVSSVESQNFNRIH